MSTRWQINGWFPQGHRGIDAAPEGGCKTIWGAWLAICIAANAPIFGHEVEGGNVLIVDEETPLSSLRRLLDRFAQGLGYESSSELPITILSMIGFRFGRRGARTNLLEIISKIKPKFIRFDSYLAMLPGGRQGLGENNCESGVAVRDDLQAVKDASPRCNILLSAHSSKPVTDWGVEQYTRSAMQDLVRGHGSLVGEACDTGFCIKKLSEYPKPLQFAVVTKARREAVPMSAEVVYVGMEEERYGEGAARLVRILPVSDPPSKAAKSLFRLFVDSLPHTETEIVKKNALCTRCQNSDAVQELKMQRIILDHPTLPFCYILNSDYLRVGAASYVERLS